MSFGSISWQPSGSWSAVANTPTIMPRSNWVCTQDASGENEVGKTVMTGEDGVLVVPYSGEFQFQMACDFLNDFGYTGNVFVSVIYTPVNPASTSPTYTITSATYTNGITSEKLNNVVNANAGDKISIKFQFTSDLASVAVNPVCNTIFILQDVTNDTSPRFLYGNSGQPPSMGDEAQQCLMQSAIIRNNTATITLTQCGTAQGASKFTQGITHVSVGVESSVPDTTLTPPSINYYFISSDLKAITIVFNRSGSTTAANFAPVTWTANVMVQGA